MNGMFLTITPKEQTFGSRTPNKDIFIKSLKELFFQLEVNGLDCIQRIGLVKDGKIEKSLPISECEE